MLLSNCVVYGSKKSTFIKEQEAKGLLDMTRKQSVSKYHGNFKKALLKSPLSPYTILQTHNIPGRKLCSLFLNIVKRGKGRETQNSPNSSFSHDFCHWFSEKYAKFGVWYFRVANFESIWRHAFTYYVTII